MRYKRIRFAKCRGQYVKVTSKVGSLLMIQFPNGAREIVGRTDLEFISKSEYLKKTKIDEKKKLGDS